jgi:hypothetical protein
MFRFWLALPLVFSNISTAADAASRPGAASQQCRLIEDAASPTWNAIGQQYSKLARAIQRKDFDAMLALYAPTFEVKVPKGELARQTGPVWNREQSLAYQKAGLERVQQTRLISNTITRLNDCGNRAVATVLQQWYRTQNMAGGLHKVETAAVQDEEWIKTADGWKRGNIGNVHTGAWLVDGKRVDPGKGFNPNAPPYDPYPERPSSNR